MTVLPGLGMQLPDEWAHATLGDVTSKVGSGATPRGGASVYVSSGPSLIRSQNVHDHEFRPDGLVFLSSQAADALRGVTVESGDVLINITGDSILRTALVPDYVLPARVNQHVSIIRSNGRIVPAFLQKWLSLAVMKDHMLGHSSGGTRKAITKGHLLSFPVPLPSLEEQNAIASTLLSLDDKIESNRRIVDQALALARAVVDRAVSGRELAGYTTALEVLMGAAFKGDKFSEPGVGRPLLRIRDLKTFASQTWTTEERRDETVIRPGDIVVGMDAEFRATLWQGDDSMLNQRVCSFRGKGDVGRAFVLAALEPELAFQEKAKTGTTVIHLNKSDIENFVVPALTPSEHRRLSALTEPLIDLAVARAVEARVLARTRDALLPDLLSGRIRAAGLKELVV